MNSITKNSKQELWQKIASPLYPFYLSIARAIRRNRLLIRILFKVRLPRSDRRKISWDFTTIMMKHAIGKRITNANTSVLEIGVGQAALLCIYLVRTSGIQPDGVDIIADRVKQSHRIARYNSISLRLWQSDLFERVENKYDFIFWNASYIPTEFGKQYNLTHSSDLGDCRAWDGGSNGTDAIVRFLTQAPDYLTPQGEILLGVNRFYVPGETISRILKTTSLTLVDRISRMFNPSVVYVLHLKGTKNAT